MYSSLKSKKIIVIGGSSGIGFAVANIAAALGAEVILTSRNAEKADSAAKKIGGDVTGHPLDINNENAVIDFFKPIVAVDHIYVAAGSVKLGAVTEGNLEDNMLSFNTRLLGSLRIVRAVVTKMNANGSVTFTGGVSTERPIAGAWVSALGTAAAEQLARVLVMEYPGIRFNAISPGYTDTPMWDEVMGENKASILAQVASTLPVKKIATAEEVAQAVIFLMSNASITGEVIHIDGGARLI